MTPAMVQMGTITHWYLESQMGTDLNLRYLRSCRLAFCEFVTTELEHREVLCPSEHVATAAGSRGASCGCSALPALTLYCTLVSTAPASGVNLDVVCKSSCEGPL